MISCIRSVSVQYFSSPNVSKRKICFPSATRVGSSCSGAGSVGFLSQETAAPAEASARAALHASTERRISLSSELFVQVLGREHVGLECRRHLHDEILHLGIFDRGEQRRRH